MSIVENETPWYFREALAIEDERPLEEPHLARENSPEWCLLRAYDGVRREIVESPRPLENQLRRRRLLEQAVALMVAFHGRAIHAGPLLAIPSGGGVEVVRSPSYPSAMARDNPGGRKASGPGMASGPTPERYEPPTDAREGDLRGTARTVEGRVVWSVKTLWSVLGRKDVDLAMGRVRYITPIAEHPAIFPVIRAKVGGRHPRLVCVTLAGLRAMAPFVTGPAGKALRGYLGTVG